MNEPMQPTYYVQHPDGSYGKADPQPVLQQRGPLVMLCSKCFGWGCLTSGEACTHCSGVGSYAEEPRACGVGAVDGGKAGC